MFIGLFKGLIIGITVLKFKNSTTWRQVKYIIDLVNIHVTFISLQTSVTQKLLNPSIHILSNCSPSVRLVSCFSFTRTIYHSYHTSDNADFVIPSKSSVTVYLLRPCEINNRSCKINDFIKRKKVLRLYEGLSYTLLL